MCVILFVNSRLCKTVYTGLINYHCLLNLSTDCCLEMPLKLGGCRHLISNWSNIALSPKTIIFVFSRSVEASHPLLEEHFSFVTHLIINLTFVSMDVIHLLSIALCHASITDIILTLTQNQQPDSQEAAASAVHTQTLMPMNLHSLPLRASWGEAGSK